MAAISTAPGRAGIAIVRISGPQAMTIGEAVLRCAAPALAERPAGTFVHGHVVSPGGEALDEAIALIYRAPHSYTREDVVELQCHGGRAAAARVLAAILDAGARLAEPGEFTRRAFLNGRIDLAEAEAVADLINARTTRAASAALRQLDGELSHKVNLIYQALVEVTATLEATLDFEVDDLPSSVIQDVVNQLDETIADLCSLLATWQEGRLLREGARVVISGAPNVGKSTLMNRLLGHDRAIVTAVPGTTRDTIEADLELCGVPVCLVDTAGLRDSTCEIEREGISRAEASRRDADLVLHVVDATPRSEDPFLADTDVPILRIRNKMDLRDEPPPLPDDMIPCSAHTGDGIEDLKEAIVRALGLQDEGEGHAVISERHGRLVTAAHEACQKARAILARNDEAEHVFVAEHLKEAMEALGLVVGRTYSVELLDSVFGRFCIGK